MESLVPSRVDEARIFSFLDINVRSTSAASLPFCINIRSGLRLLQGVRVGERVDKSMAGCGFGRDASCLVHIKAHASPGFTWEWTLNDAQHPGLGEQKEGN